MQTEAETYRRVGGGGNVSAYGRIGCRRVGRRIGVWRVGVTVDPQTVLVLVLVLDRLPFFDRATRRGGYVFPHTPTRRYADTPTRSPTSRVPGKSGRPPYRSVDPDAQYGSV
jgi:hypothetical protein